MPRPDPRDSLQDPAALWSIGAVSSAEVAARACDVLVAGLDTPSLRILAGLTCSEADSSHAPTARISRAALADEPTTSSANDKQSCAR